MTSAKRVSDGEHPFSAVTDKRGSSHTEDDSESRVEPILTTRRTETVDLTEAKHKIDALKAIMKTVMPVVYPHTEEGSARTFFYEMLEDDDPLTMALANELTEKEIDEAFGWVEATQGSVENELRVTPIVTHLAAAQVERMRVMLVAVDAEDDAHAFATRAPNPPGTESVGKKARIGIAERFFVAAMVRDLAEQRGEAADRDPTSTDNEKFEELPEPWRKHTRKGVERVRIRTMKTLDDSEHDTPPS